VALEYRLDGGAWTAYNGPVAVSPDGAHTVEYRAKDAAGNVSAVKSVSFRIDKPSEVNGDVMGTVPPTLAVTLGAPASFGAFLPGVAKDYLASTVATVTSSAADATLSVTDPSTTNNGRLVNGAYALAQPLQVRALDGVFRPLGGALVTWNAPVGKEQVPVEFKQSIGQTDGLRTGAYSKTLTFTLSTTTP
jgi:hypothetical protein